jgi:hypothetical protein
VIRRRAQELLDGGVARKWTERRVACRRTTIAEAAAHTRPDSLERSEHPPEQFIGKIVDGRSTANEEGHLVEGVGHDPGGGFSPHISLQGAAARSLVRPYSGVPSLFIGDEATRKRKLGSP